MLTESSNAGGILSAHPLFAPCDPALLDRASRVCRQTAFSPGEAIKGYEDAPFLCILISGRAAVYTKDASGDLLLHVLRDGDTFGVASLFADGGTSRVPAQVTRIIAETRTELLCMDENTLKELLLADPALSLRYIAFLTDRIRFLNRRLSCVGAGSAAARLAAWLDANLPARTDGDGRSLPCPLSIPMNRLAEVLGLGRASLYRAWDELSEQGLVIRKTHTVMIPDRAALRLAYGLS